MAFLCVLHNNARVDFGHEHEQQRRLMQRWYAFNSNKRAPIKPGPACGCMLCTFSRSTTSNAAHVKQAPYRLHRTIWITYVLLHVPCYSHCAIDSGHIYSSVVVVASQNNNHPRDANGSTRMQMQHRGWTVYMCLWRHAPARVLSRRPKQVVK